VTIVTPASEVSSWSHYTLEFEHIQIKLRELGVKIIPSHGVKAIREGSITLECVYIGTEMEIEADAIIPVTSRTSCDDLFSELDARKDEWQDHGIKSVTRIGDCIAPGTIAMAVYSGHQFARNLEMPVNADQPFKRENDFELNKRWDGIADG